MERRARYTSRATWWVVGIQIEVSRNSQLLGRLLLRMFGAVTWRIKLSRRMQCLAGHTHTRSLTHTYTLLDEAKTELSCCEDLLPRQEEKMVENEEPGGESDINSGKGEMVPN